MIKGSLHTMNYLKPKGFIGNFKAFFRKGHFADIEVQYDLYNVRAFDLHVAFTHSGKPYFSYNGISYKSPSIYKILNFLDRNNDVYVRIVLEGDGVRNEEHFYNFCSILEQIYKNMHFFGGYREKDSKIIYLFKGCGFMPKINWYRRLY